MYERSHMNRAVYEVYERSHMNRVVYTITKQRRTAGLLHCVADHISNTDTPTKLKEAISAQCDGLDWEIGYFV